MTAVYDASVVVRWYVDEPLGPAALAARSQHGPAVAPALLSAEVANAFRRHVVRGSMSSDTAVENLRTVVALVTLTDHQSILEEALRLACARNHSVHDCLYIALALRRDLPLVTADGKLARKFEDLVGLNLHPLAAMN